MIVKYTVGVRYVHREVYKSVDEMFPEQMCLQMFFKDREGSACRDGVTVRSVGRDAWLQRLVD